MTSNGQVISSIAKKNPTPASLVPAERIEQSILLIRGHKVLLDQDLAQLYGVETKVFNQAVKRNLERFPDDFMCSNSPWRSSITCGHKL